MRRPGRILSLAVVAATGLAVFTGVGGAAAAPATKPVALPGAYVTPLQFAIGTHLYVADGARSALFRSGTRAPIALGPTPSRNPENSGDLAGVAVDRGRVAYTTTEANHRNTYLTVLQHGKRILRVNLGLYERQHNPDAVNHYGVADPASVSKACAAEIKKAGAPLAYTGLKDSHAYSVTGVADGWLVADAGGNDIVKVSDSGAISTFSVLPPQPVTVTTAIAKQLGAPHCVGVTYAFEPVPTDVEVGPAGVYVSTLPGGAGGLGSVYTIGFGGGAANRIATGFPEATNLAVAPDGTVYVVELGAGVFTLDGKPYVKLPGAAAAEWWCGKLYVSTAPAALGGKGLGHIYRIG